MKLVIVINFLIALMLMCAPVLIDTLTHAGSDKSAAETTLTTGTQDTEKSNATESQPCVQPDQMQQNTNETTGTLFGKNTVNLIIIFDYHFITIL